jgi:signal transduction histidine kinase
MRERAQALGGDVEVGPLLGSGFRVRATVPFLARP